MTSFFEGEQAKKAFKNINSYAISATQKNKEETQQSGKGTSKKERKYFDLIVMDMRNNGGGSVGILRVLIGFLLNFEVSKLVD